MEVESQLELEDLVLPANSDHCNLDKKNDMISSYQSMLHQLGLQFFFSICQHRAI
jgi:hypothetical protein